MMTSLNGTKAELGLVTGPIMLVILKQNYRILKQQFLCIVDKMPPGAGISVLHSGITMLHQLKCMPQNIYPLATKWTPLQPR